MWMMHSVRYSLTKNSGNRTSIRGAAIDRPDLHMSIGVCRGLITAGEFFTEADTAFVDKRHRPGMISVIDLLSAMGDFYMEDLRATTERIGKTGDEGFVPGPIVVLSQSRGVHIWVDTIKLLPRRIPSDGGI